MSKDQTKTKNAIPLTKAERGRLVFLDGSYGTEIQRRGYSGLADPLNIQEPNFVEQVHLDYARAGADLLLTNTFSANRLKLTESGEEKNLAAINRDGVKLAKAAANQVAADRGRDIKVVGDISSTGDFITPVGRLDFHQVQAVFKEQASILVESGADMIKIETLTDIKELKAALIGVREASSTIPVIASMSFEEDKKTITGTSIQAYISLLNDLPVDIIGLNCGIKSKEMVEMVKHAAEFSIKPLCVSPNAGNPGMDLSYSEKADEFAFYLDVISDIAGVAIVGGCCGTTPEYVQTYCNQLSGKPAAPPKLTWSDTPADLTSRTALASWHNFIKIGERINPASREDFQEELNQKNYSRIYDEAFAQISEGSEIIDLNLGVEKYFSPEDVEEIIDGLDAMGTNPLSLDLQSYSLLERAMKIYPGRPLINSSTCDPEKIEQLAGLMKKYGGVLVVLAMKGTPKASAEERLEELKKGLDNLQKLGISRSRLVIDPLVLPMGGKHSPEITLKLISKLNEDCNLKTTIGLSNLSHGLPERSYLNAAFVSMAVQNGLNSAIMDTGDTIVVKAVQKSLSLMGKESAWQESGVDTESELVKAILTGKTNQVKDQIMAHLKDRSPLEVSQKVLGEAMREIGELYNEKKIYLPQLLLAAETVQPAFDYLSSQMDQEESTSKGKIILATVEGDVHDIGKKIVGTILKSGGFEIHDLGINVAAETIVEEIKKLNPDILGLSAMMTSTIQRIEDVTQLMQQESIKDVKVIAGGASLNPQLAKEFGCNAYAKDAYQALKKCEDLVQN